MYLTGRPYTLALVELESQLLDRLTGGKPLLIEEAYRTISRDYGKTLTEDERVCLEAYRILLEEEASKLQFQVNAARKLYNDKKDFINRWSSACVKNWSKLTESQKLSAIIVGIGDDAKDAIHKAFVAAGPHDGNYQKFQVEDAPALQETVNKIFLDALRKQLEDAP